MFVRCLLTLQKSLVGVLSTQGGKDCSYRMGETDLATFSRDF